MFLVYIDFEIFNNPERRFEFLWPELITSNVTYVPCLNVVGYCVEFMDQHIWSMKKWRRISEEIIVWIVADGVFFECLFDIRPENRIILEKKNVKLKYL